MKQETYKMSIDIIELNDLIDVLYFAVSPNSKKGIRARKADTKTLNQYMTLIDRLNRIKANQ